MGCGGFEQANSEKKYVHAIWGQRVLKYDYTTVTICAKIESVTKERYYGKSNNERGSEVKAYQPWT